MTENSTENLDNELDEVEPAEPNDADVDEILNRETADGSGLENDDESNLPESDLDESEETD